MQSRFCDGFGKHSIICLIFFFNSFFLLLSSALAAPTVTILTPSNGARLDAGASVFFSSDVVLGDPANDEVSEYFWHSSLQGLLSEEGSFTTNTLQVGLHTVTLQVTDNNNDSDAAFIQIEVVNDPPDVSIITPVADAVFGFGELITFRGNVNDPQEGRLSGTSLVWTSSQGDAIGTGEAVAVDTLSSGEHVITLTATDSLGASDFASARIFVGNSPPQAEITAPTDGQQFAFREPITFRGTGEDGEDGTLPASSLQWSLPATDTNLGQGTVLAVDDLESGTHTIRLTVADSDGATATDEIVVIVGNASPVATITEPADNSQYAFGESISFRGGATDSEDGTLTGISLEWRSDLSGFLGTGTSFSTDTLAVGQHEISLIATDSEGMEGTDTIRIVVGDQAPSAVSIDSPSDGDSFFLTDFITFQGAAQDNEDGALTGGNLVWTSNLEQDPIGTGTSFSTNTLSEGEHRITLTATDSSGLSISTFIIITVGNRLPVVVITTPENNSLFAFGELVTFMGTGNDEDDGRLIGASLVWTSNKSADPIGTGETVSTSSLSSGLHTITLTGTDSSGASVTDSITITVENSVPTTEIISPADGTLFSDGDTILLTGTGNDAEDGALTGLSLVWTLAATSQTLGSGTTLSVTLDSGSHIITLTASDSQGVSATDTISIIVGKPSTVAILSPLDDASFSLNEPIEFIGEAFDNEDGQLSGESLVWSSNRVATALGTGSRLSIDTLEIGSHLITLTATDSSGNIQRAFITITIVGKPSTVAILSPSDEASFSLNEPIEFIGEAFDNEDGQLSGESLVWTSNRVATALGTGSRLSIDTLGIGSHLITLTVTDSAGNIQRAFVTIAIEAAQAPQVTITAPGDGASFHLNDYIEFRGSATDNEDGPLTRESLVWSSSLETAILGTGELLNIDSLSMGEHMITLTATDSDNIPGIDFVVITIENHPPVPMITSPADQSQFDDGEDIIFTGSATDEEDGVLTGSSLTWTSDLDGFIGSGVRFANSLSQGEHVISLTAKDSHGQEVKTTTVLTVNPTDQSQPMALAEQYLTVPLGQTETVSVTGGHPPFRYFREYPHIASMDITGREIRVVPELMGETTFRIVDHFNSTRILYLTVTDTADNIPIADAGGDQSVSEGMTVTLDGNATSPGSYGIRSWEWRQMDDNKNSIVVLSDSTSAKAQFIAPSAVETAVLTFRLTVTDNNASVSSDDVTINVSANGIEGYPQGVITFLTADSANSLGARVVGEGDFVVIDPRRQEFIRQNNGRPENMIYGLIDLKIKVDPGAGADMILYLPTPLEEGYGVYKYDEIANRWYSYSDNVTFSSDRSKVYVTLTDGGEGDDDGGVMDGIIADPITFGSPPLSPPDPVDPVDPPPDTGGSGGGGCFISTLFD